jgi:hypothetical protein
VKRFSTALAFLLIAGPAAAQSTEYGPLALRLPASARMGAMGDIGVAGRDDDVIFYNPAQLFIARGTSFSLARLSETARGGTMSTVLRLGPGAIGVGANYLEYQAATLSYPFGRDQVFDRNTSHGSSVLGAVGYAQVYKGFRFGAAAKYAADAVDMERFSGLYADAGIAREIGRYTAALSVQNLGESMSRGSQPIKPPMTATLGTATSRPMGPLDVIATAAASWSKEDDFTGGAGAEIGWSWIAGYNVYGRGGFHTPRTFGGADFTGGFGLVADRTAIDFAAEFFPAGRKAFRAGIRIR